MGDVTHEREAGCPSPGTGANPWPAGAAGVPWWCEVGNPPCPEWCAVSHEPTEFGDNGGWWEHAAYDLLHTGGQEVAPGVTVQLDRLQRVEAGEEAGSYVVGSDDVEVRIDGLPEDPLNPPLQLMVAVAREVLRLAALVEPVRAPSA